MYIGIGILLLPNAFAMGGLLVTSVFVIFITLTFTHGMLLMVSQKIFYAHHQKDTFHFVPMLLQINLLDKIKQTTDNHVLDFATLVEIVLAQSNYNSWKRFAR